MANVSISGLRRNIKNVAHNYTDAQVKVREATSNDPWGPSSTQMSEIADLTYNTITFSEIMQMIWKRLNDHGKNWRHVYKALVLLEYLIKTGNDKVAKQCQENIFAIQTLKDFQFFEDNKDQGLNVREKAKAMVALLKDDERLKNERVRALKAKERFAQSTAGIGSDTALTVGGLEGDGSPLRSPQQGQQGDANLKPDIELARPQTQGEEELQLQLALAMSREEADDMATKTASDDMRLSLAIQKSKEEPLETGEKQPEKGGSAINDLLDIGFGGPGPNPPQRTAASLDPWSPLGAGGGGPEATADPWGGIISKNNLPDPWGGIGAAGVPPSRASPIGGQAFGSPPHSQEATGDPWGSSGTATEAVSQAWNTQPPAQPGPQSNLYPQLDQGGMNTMGDPFAGSNGGQNSSGPPVPSAIGDSADLMSAFGAQTSPTAGGGGSQSLGGQSNPWDLSGLDPMGSVDIATNNGAKPKNTVETLLGEHSNLINLDNLVKVKSSAATGAVPKNPFADQPNPFQSPYAWTANPFQAAAAPKPTINQLRTAGQPVTNSPWPDSQQNKAEADTNPFF